LNTPLAVIEWNPDRITKWIGNREAPSDGGV
jgi:hypothetical protein